MIQSHVHDCIIIVVLGMILVHSIIQKLDCIIINLLAEMLLQLGYSQEHYIIIIIHAVVIVLANH